MTNALAVLSERIDMKLSDEELSLTQVNFLRNEQLHLVDAQIAALAAQVHDGSDSSASQQEIYLTARETEILDLISQGLSASQIALSLVLSVPTIKSHTSSLYRKLAATSRTQALYRATELGIIRRK